eukprot:888958-Rhodomonas_salina.1
MVALPLSVALRAAQTEADLQARTLLVPGQEVHSRFERARGPLSVTRRGPCPLRPLHWGPCGRWKSEADA